MKKVIFSLLVITFSVSCSKKETSSIPDHNAVTVTAEEPPVVDSAAVSAKNIAEGKVLIEGADCLTCHKNDEKLIGPSYFEVANKYDNNPANIELLAGKIVDGGSGVWGNVPMAAHPGMSKENAKKMVAYIMSLKK